MLKYQINELDKMLKEVRDVYQDEKQEGNIEGWEEKQRFIQETVDLYLEKIKMGRYNTIEIFENLAEKHQLNQTKTYIKEKRMVSVAEMVDFFIASHLETEIRRVIAKEEQKAE